LDIYLKSGPELTAILERSGVDTIAVDIQVGRCRLTA
jgi:hypothetical protein